MNRESLAEVNFVHTSPLSISSNQLVSLIESMGQMMEDRHYE